jgi:outer membrane lipoprotein SlyB
VVGGVVGHQFGGGHGKDALTIAGAVGGALAGNEVEKQARARILYHVDVKLDDGTARTFDYAQPPGVSVGLRVEVQGNQLRARG